ncbi:MAG: hypothetical protein M9957_14950 [Rhodobacteraceae bacterium]|nr:hypothetical protein [Paracoccaceae bacterium]
MEKAECVSVPTLPLSRLLASLNGADRKVDKITASLGGATEEAEITNEQ